MFYCPYLNGGGAEKHFARLISALDERYFHKTLVVSKRDGSYEYLLTESTVEYISLDIHSKSSLKRAIKSVIPLKRTILNVNPDIVLSIMDYANVFCTIAHKLSNHRSKLIVDVQTSTKKAIEFNKSLISKLILYGMKKLYKDADYILCLSNGVSKELQTILINTKAEQYHVIHNIGIEQKDFAISSEKIKHQVCICGRLLPLRDSIL